MSRLRRRRASRYRPHEWLQAQRTRHSSEVRLAPRTLHLSFLIARQALQRLERRDASAKEPTRRYTIVRYFSEHAVQLRMRRHWYCAWRHHLRRVVVLLVCRVGVGVRVRVCVGVIACWDDGRGE